MKRIYLLLIVVLAFACSDKEEPSCASDLSAFTLEDNVVYTGQKVVIGYAQLCPLADVTVTVNGQQVSILSDGDEGTAEGAPYFVMPAIGESAATITVKAGKDEVTLTNIPVVKAYGTWKAVAPFTGTGRSGMSKFATTSDGYLFGGNSWATVDGEDFSDLYKYNPQGNTWTKVTTDDALNSYGYSEAFTDNKLFLPGKVYTIANNSFSPIAYMNSRIDDINWARRYFTLNGEVYVISNLNEKLIEVQRYNKEANTWAVVKQQAHLKNGEQEYFQFDFAIEREGKVYIGIQFANTTVEEMWSFDGTNLTKVNSVSTGLEGSTQSLNYLFTIDDLAYFVENGEAFTDDDHTGSIIEPRSELYVYNFEANQWRQVQTEFPESLFRISSLNIGNRGFAGMGVSTGTTLYVHSKNFYEFIPTK